MKRIICFMLVVAGVAVEAAPPMILLSARNKMNSDSDQTGEIQHRFNNSIGADENRVVSVTKSKTQSFELSLQVKNMDKAAQKCQVQWYFTAKPNGSMNRYVFDKGSATLDLAAYGSTNIQAKSASLSSSSKQGEGGAKTRTGSKADGFIVRAMVGSDVVAVTASDATLTQLAKDPKRFDALVATESPATGKR